MKIICKEVLIFKASVEEVDHECEDPYISLLRLSQFSVKSLPVLEFYFCNLQDLQECLLKPEKYSGIIFTSPRAVKAAALSLDTKSLPSDWKRIPAFVVGEGSARILHDELGLQGEGSTAGNASNLADLIVEKKYTRPLLFPCGNLKRDTLPIKLHDAGIDVDIITVYQSRPHPQMAENLRMATSNGMQISEYFVFFSPSGVQYSLPILQEMRVPLNDIKIVAIGPSTKTCLEESKMKVWSSAHKPTPECLLEAIINGIT